jgi:arabinofuranan 3-O-arabinosyltransferase
MELDKNIVKECIEICISKKAQGVVIPEKSVGEGYWANVRAFERIYNKGNNNVEAARFFPKKIMAEIGGYDPNIVGAEDWDLQQRFFKKGYKVARTKNYLIHNEGEINLWKLLKKKMYYGKAFLLYKNRYPKAFKNAIVRRELFSHWQDFLKKPKYGLGVFLLKYLEGMALLMGMIIAKFGINPTHY